MVFGDLLFIPLRVQLFIDDVIHIDIKLYTEALAHPGEVQFQFIESFRYIIDEHIDLIAAARQFAYFAIELIYTASGVVVALFGICNFFFYCFFISISLEENTFYLFELSLIFLDSEIALSDDLIIAGELCSETLYLAIFEIQLLRYRIDAVLLLVKLNILLIEAG